MGKLGGCFNCKQNRVHLRTYNKRHLFQMPRSASFASLDARPAAAIVAANGNSVTHLSTTSNRIEVDSDHVLKILAVFVDHSEREKALRPLIGTFERLSVSRRLSEPSQSRSRDTCGCGGRACGPAAPRLDTIVMTMAQIANRES